VYDRLCIPITNKEQYKKVIDIVDILGILFNQNTYDMTSGDEVLDYMLVYNKMDNRLYRHSRCFTDNIPPSTKLLNIFGVDPK